jgi:hypothetical protein
MNTVRHCFICSPSNSNLSEDAGIELRIVTTLALAVSCSNHLARSNPALAEVDGKTKNIAAHKNCNTFYLISYNWQKIPTWSF